MTLPTNTSRTELSGVIRDALQLPEDFDLDEAKRPAQIPGWDSVGWTAVLASLERRYGHTVSLLALDDAVTIGDILDILSTKEAWQ